MRTPLPRTSNSGSGSDNNNEADPRGRPQDINKWGREGERMKQQQSVFQHKNSGVQLNPQQAWGQPNMSVFIDLYTFFH